MPGEDAREPGQNALTMRLAAQTFACVGRMLRAPAEGFDAALDDLLAHLAETCGADRVWILRRSEDGGTNDRAAAGRVWPPATSPVAVSPVAPALTADLPDSWRRTLESGDCVSIDTAAGLPATLRDQGIGSLVLVPLGSGDGFAGVLALGAAQSGGIVPAGAPDLLPALGESLGAALVRADRDAADARARITLEEANRRLTSTLRAMPDLILELDGDGRYIDIHTADPGQMMIPPEQLIGLTDSDILPPEIIEINRRALAEVDERGRSGPHPFWVDTARGRRRYVMTASQRPPIRPDEAPGYVFLSRDVTEEWTLQREAERLSLIARRMAEMVVVVDPDRRIEWVNPAFESRTGWTLDEIRGRYGPDILKNPQTDPALRDRIDTLMASGQPVHAEVLTKTRAGESFWVEVDIQPLNDRNGDLTGYVFIGIDITVRRAHAATLARLADEAQAARARLEAAVDALPYAFVYIDATDRLVLCNDGYRALHPGAKPGDPVPRAAPPADGDRAEEIRIADGRWMRLIERPTPEGGRVGMSIDITALKETERRLVDIIHGAEAGTWEWHVASDCNYINARWAEIVGYRPEELEPVTIHTWRRLVHPTDLHAINTALERVFRREADQFEYQMRMRHKAGHWVQVMSRGRVVRWSADGAPELMAGVHLDITAVKRAEDRLAQIIDAARAGTWQMDFREGQQAINHHWAAMLGYSVEELAALPSFGFRLLTHPEDLAMLDRQHQEQLLSGQSHFENEFRMRHRDGRWIWLLSRGQVVDWDSAGKPIRSAGIHLDINDRKQLETQLTAERDYLARLMETSTSGITALDCEGRIIFANREAERIMGLSVSDIVGRTHDAIDWRITTPEGAQIADDDLPFNRVIMTGETLRDVRVEIATPGGARRILSLNVAPIQAEGLAVRVVCALRDITEQVAADRALRATAERAEAANQAKSRFLANMSHEIRTPLNGILGMAQALEDELPDPRHRETLGIIRDSGEMLLGVLNDILDMSKIEAGKLALEEVAFDLGALAARIEAMHGPTARSKGLDFGLTLADTLHRQRQGDPNRISQVLHNLVGNAIKFTQHGQVTVSLQAAAPEVLEIRVRDTGIGMTESQLSRMFDDFEQADGSVTRRFGGTGLGMSIVRRLVELMRGMIDVTSTPSIGTEVRLLLPLPRADRPATPPEPAPGGAARALPGLRVLAADDNHTNRLVLKAMLSHLEVEFELVADGRAAVEAWQPGRFDVYLLDISMPELDGISALRELRRREAAAGLPPAPALAITANALSHQVAEYAEAGFAGHLGKPFRREALAAALVAAAGSVTARVRAAGA